jgi:hypothetical protein
VICAAVDWNPDWPHRKPKRLPGCRRNTAGGIQPLEKGLVGEKMRPAGSPYVPTASSASQEMTAVATESGLLGISSAGGIKRHCCKKSPGEAAGSGPQTLSA